MEDNIPDFKGIEDLNNIFEEIDEGFYIPNPNTKKETIYSFFSFFLNDTINEDKKNQVILKLKEIFDMNKDLPLIYFKDYSIEGKKEKLNLIQCIYDLYFKSNNELKQNIINLIIFFINNHLINKNHIDYIYYKIGKEYSNENIENYESTLDLLITIFDNLNKVKSNNIKEIYNSYINIITENSIYKINNLSEKNPIFIEEGFCIEVYFYISKYDKKNEIKIMDIDLFYRSQGILNLFKKKENPRNQKKSNKNLKIFLSKNPKSILFSIDNKKKNELIKLNDMILYGWNQLQIFLKGQNDNDVKQDKILIGFFKNFEKGEKFIGNYTNIEIGDRINSINLFENFIGKISKVSFIKRSIKNKISEQDIKRLISYENELNQVYACFLPNKSNNLNIFDQIHNLKSSIVNNEQNKICYNYIYDYSEYNNSLFDLGNINNLLPLYEIFYKHFNNKNNDDDDIIEDDFENEENKIKINIFKKLIQLSNIFLNDEKIFNDAFNIHFYIHLSVFYENFDDIIFHADNELSFYFIILMKLNLLIVEGNKDKNEINKYNEYISFILLNPKIIMKLSSQQKIKLKSIFDNYLRPILKNMLPLIPNFTLYLYTKKKKLMMVYLNLLIP
jgi:hypothetical protein